MISNWIVSTLPADGQDFELPPIITMEQNEPELVNDEHNIDKPNTKPKSIQEEIDNVNNYTRQPKLMNNHNQDSPNENITYNSQFTTFTLTPSGTISNELRQHNHNKHRMSPTQTTQIESTKKQKTRDEIDCEADIADMEIKKRTDNTLNDILNKVHNHINLQNIKITKTDQKQNVDSNEQNHG